MFQQVEETTRFLTPFDLIDSSLAPKIQEAGPIDLTSLADALPAKSSDSAVAAFCAALDLPVPSPATALFAPVADQDSISAFDMYGQALTYLNAQDVTKAIAIFCFLADRAAIAGPAYCALAACACQQNQFKHGFTFALKSIALQEKHPRVYLIAGYCALQIGDKKHAKKHLALTTRLARSNPACRNELRSAQRELLLMQISS